MPPPILTARQLNRATLARQLLLARQPIGPARGDRAPRRPPGAGAAAPVHRPLVAARSVPARGSPRRAAWPRGRARDAHAGDAAPAGRRRLRSLPAGARAGHGAGAARARRTRGRARPRARGRGCRGAAARAAARLRRAARALQQQFPGVNDRALGYTVRMQVPLVMVPSEARWGFPSVADFTLAETWLGHRSPPTGTPEQLVLRYLAAFGPASAADAQTWSGLQGLAPVFEGLRPQLVAFRPASGPARALRPARRTAARRGRRGARAVPARVRQPRPRARRSHAPARRGAPRQDRHQEPARACDVPVGRDGRGHVGDHAHARRGDAPDDAVPRAAAQRGQGADGRGRGACCASPRTTPGRWRSSPPGDGALRREAPRA